MEVGISARVLWASERNLAVNLDYISKNADAAELWLMPPFFPSWRTSQMKGDLDRLKDVLTAYDVKTTLHAPYHDMNFASLNPSAASVAFREVEKSLEVADLLGSLVVTFHPGGFRYEKEKGFETLKANLRRLDGKAREHNTLLCVENMAGERKYLTRPGEIAEALSGLDSIHVTLDVPHAMYQGADVEGFVNEISGRIRHVHVADFKTGQDLHIPLGEGNLDLGRAFKSLKGIGYSGLFILEGLSSNPQATVPQDVKRLRAMLAEAGFT